MTIKVGINGFGRMGKLAARLLLPKADIALLRINDPSGNAATWSHLLNFDSVHGRWDYAADTEGEMLVACGQSVAVSANTDIAATDWSECNIVIEASGKFRTPGQLQNYLDQGVSRVVVTAPVDGEDILNIVMGVNHGLFDPERHRIVTAASCTTNCLAPVVKVIHENFGIQRGSMTTIHSITNTQRILDSAHKDPRRARACGSSLIPTTTGSAKAITRIFPELEGRLNGHAVRVPLANASLTDCVFDLASTTDAETVNSALQAAAAGPLQGILGFEARPLVSVDYRSDPRSAIIDAPSTMVVDGTHLKIYAWYDNEWGYINRTVELVRMVAEPGS